MINGLLPSTCCASIPLPLACRQRCERPSSRAFTTDLPLVKGRTAADLTDALASSTLAHGRETGSPRRGSGGARLHIEGRVQRLSPGSRRVPPGGPDGGPPQGGGCDGPTGRRVIRA